MCTAFLQIWCNVIHCQSAYKNGFHCVPRMLEHVCYEPISLKNLQIWKISYVNWSNFVYCLKFTRLRPDLSK